MKARSALNQKIKFKFKSGTLSPDTLTPADSKGFTDCSSFICWALNIPKVVPGGILNIEGIYKSNLFKLSEHPAEGTLIIYPSTVSSGNRVTGHVAIISKSHGGIPTKIIHAHPDLPNVIEETGLDMFFGKPSIYLELKA